MIEKATIQKIIEEAVQAPSGDNAQPWRFVLTDEGVEVHNVERDQTLFNFERRGDYIAHGALLENISIIAGHYGLTADTKLFPNGYGLHIATVSFANGGSGNDDLYQAIEKRATNRKPYNGEMISETDKQKLLEVARESDTVRVLIANEKDAVKKIAQAASLNDWLILKNKAIREFLFSIIRWTDEEERMSPGMHVQTLELKPPQQKIFRLFRNERIARIATRIGFSNIMRKEAEALYGTSGGMLVVMLKDKRPEDFITGGMLFQRVWLLVTAIGLSMQPLAAVPYLAQRIKAGSGEGIPRDQVDKILEAEQNIRQAAGAQDGIIAMVARIGKADRPTGRAFKLRPDITWHINNI